MGVQKCAPFSFATCAKLRANVRKFGLWCNTNPIRENKPNTAKIKPNRSKDNDKGQCPQAVQLTKEDIYYDII